MDKVVFTSSGGAPAFNIGSGEEVVFDNLTVSSVTPEPATLLLFGTGLAGIGSVLRRRRRTGTRS